MNWLIKHGLDRTLIAWNGQNFDFEVLRNHIQQYCPTYSDIWESVEKADLLHWAIDNNNAVFPSRSNKLENVATALGWTTENTGLTGKQVAEAYRDWIENQSPATELDWDKHEAYCQDDVESLAYIYHSIEEATSLTKTINSDHSKQRQTQGNLRGW
jgi:uncharacterized protein YprB with RNaseH-like and TPR domain